jgi:nucleoside recognition membrane protein YjiH
MTHVDTPFHALLYNSNNMFIMTTLMSQVAKDGPHNPNTSINILKIAYWESVCCPLTTYNVLQ